MTFYCKSRKNFLDYIEDSISHESLIGSTISNRSKKSVPCANKISSPIVLSHDTKTSKVSEKDNPHDFYPKNFNHAFLSKSDFEGYINNAKKEFEENQNYVGDEFHQELDHPSTLMKMVKERTRAMSVVNDERRQVLPSKSSEMEPLTILKYLETMLKVIMDKLILAIYFIQVQVSTRHI
jgi:hypothetical protein